MDQFDPSTQQHQKVYIPIRSSRSQLSSALCSGGERWDRLSGDLRAELPTLGQGPGAATLTDAGAALGAQRGQFRLVLSRTAKPGQRPSILRQGARSRLCSRGAACHFLPIAQNTYLIIEGLFYPVNTSSCSLAVKSQARAEGTALTPSALAPLPSLSPNCLSSAPSHGSCAL